MVNKIIKPTIRLIVILLILLFILILNIAIAFKIDYGAYVVWSIFLFGGLLFFLYNVQFKKELTQKKKILVFLIIWIVYTTVFLVSFHIFMSWLDDNYGIDDPFMHPVIEDGSNLTIKRYTFE